ncbi:MAG: hypothetical protein ACPLSY_01480 [Moorellaceae bacterium]
MWIWLLNECEGGNINAIINKALDLGLTGLIVKAWDGSKYWSQLDYIAGPAKEAGLTVGAWGYSYGNNVSGEVAAMERAVEAGADWLVIDAEGEYESQAGRANAIALFKAILASPVSSKYIGYSSFAFPDYHSAFPYDVFSNFCNVALPQVYWGDFGMAADKALYRCLAKYQAFNLPVVPVGQAYGDISPEEITTFGNLAASMGVPGVSFWSWQHATDGMFAAIKNLPFGRRQEKNGVSDWAKSSWDKAVAKGVLDGSDPQGAVSREILAVALDKAGLLEPEVEAPEALRLLAQKAGFTAEHNGKEMVDLNLLAEILRRLGVI